jgi:hypothetical protein
MRTPTKVGLTAVSLVAVLALARVVVGLTRSWAGIWEGYHREVLAGYDLDDLTDNDWEALGRTADREQLVAEFRAAAARLAGQVEQPRIVWPVDDPERPRFELAAGGHLVDHQLADELADDMAGRQLDPTRARGSRFVPGLDGHAFTDPPGTYLGGIEHLHVVEGPGRPKFHGTHVHTIDGQRVVHCHRQPHGWVNSSTSSPHPGGGPERTDAT